jgi:DNA mismatch endonuclease (patch repair protein)
MTAVQHSRDLLHDRKMLVEPSGDGCPHIDDGRELRSDGVATTGTVPTVASNLHNELELPGGSWASSPAVRAVMRSNKRRDTQPEMALRRAVHGLGLRYYVDRRPLTSLRRTADLVFPGARVAVFVDGCYWHRCPEHRTIARTNSEYWSHKLARNVERDRETDQLLANAGWLPLRIWEHEAPEEAALTVAAAVRARREPSRRCR